MKPLHGRSRALLEAARPAEQPSDADRARVRAGLMAKIAGAGVVAASIAAMGKAPAATTGVAGAGASTSVAAATATPGLMKAILVGAFTGLCTVGAAEIAGRWQGSGDTPAALSATAGVVVSAAPRAAKSAEIPGPQRPAPAAEALSASKPPLEPRLPHSEARVDTQAAGTASLREEVELLKEAQRAIHAGETDRALALLDAHEGRFKDGSLKEEELAARAIALCKADRDAEARRAVTQFLAKASASQLEGRVRAACARAISGGPKQD